MTESIGGDYVGSSPSLQLALGHLTATFTLWLVPALVDAPSSPLALAASTTGPVVGPVAISRVTSASTY